METLPTQMNLNSLDSILEDLKQSIDEENANLLEEVNGLQEDLIDGIRPMENINDMASLSRKLEKAYEEEARVDQSPTLDLVEKTISSDDFFGLDASLFEGIDLTREPRPVKPAKTKPILELQLCFNDILRTCI